MELDASRWRRLAAARAGLHFAAQDLVDIRRWCFHVDAAFAKPADLKRWRSGTSQSC